MSPFIFNLNGETVFFYGGQVNQTEDVFELLNESLRKYYEQGKGGITDSLVIITNKNVNVSREIITQLKKEDVFGYRNLEIIHFDENGIITEFDHFDKEENKKINGVTYLRKVQKHGIGQIFRNRNPVLKSDGTFHYVHPSGKHSDYFIRASNLLMSDAEISFIAFWLIPMINENITEILCDTSSILPIAQGALLLKTILTGKDFQIPYRSFGSYSRLKNYSFEDGSLIIISATNSGDLEKEILSKCEYKNVDIITILNNCEEYERVGNSLLNSYSLFKNIIPNPNQFDTSSRCQLCEMGSIPVIIHGDQFIPSRLSVKSILIKKSHLPRWINDKRKIFKTLVHSNSIRVYGGDDPRKIRELFLDLESVYKNIDSGNQYYLFERFIDFLENDLPLRIDTIVYLSDRASEILATKIHSYYKSKVGSGPNLVEDRIDNLRKLPQIDGTLLVVGSCISSGKKLLRVSREVRNKTDKASIMYFVPIVRAQNPQEVDVTKNNVTYRDKSGKKNRFNSILEFYIPDNHTGPYMEILKPSWDEEKKFLENAVKNSDSKYKDIIEDRFAEISEADGLIENLFLLDPFQNQKLGLRNNFAFYNFKREVGRQGTQAEVYFIVCAVLHQLRHPKILNGESPDYENCLLQHEHVRSLLSSDCFTRYNDGVIQASFLRACRGIELDYSVDSATCNKMYDILYNILIDEKSEATLEFLYSMIIGKLKLTHDQMTSLAKNVLKTHGKINSIRFYCESLLSTLH